MLCCCQFWLKYLFPFFLADTSLKFTPGPYGLIFASFIPFYLDIPVSTKIRVFGVEFSDKSFIYLAGLQVKFGLCRTFLIPFLSCSICLFFLLQTFKEFVFQLLLSSWKRSIFPGICGFVAGSLYRLNFFYIRKAKVVL